MSEYDASGDAMVSPEGKWHYVDSHPTWAHENWQRFGIERPQPWMSGDYEETDDPEAAYFDANEQTALDAFMDAGWTRVKWPSGVETRGRNPVAAQVLRRMSKDYPERDIYWDMGDKTEYYSGGRKISGDRHREAQVEWDEDYGQQHSYARNFQTIWVDPRQLVPEAMNPVSDERIQELRELTEEGYDLPLPIVNGPFEVEEDDLEYAHESVPFWDGHEAQLGEEYYTIIDGNHRVNLAIQNGETRIPVALFDEALARQAKAQVQPDRTAAALRMDPEVLKRAEEWIRTKLSQVALKNAQETLAAREEFADNLQQRRDLAETELESARQDAADGDPVTVIMGLAEPGAQAIVRVVPGDPEWRVDWESKATGEITTVKHGDLSDLNAWLVDLAETQLRRVQKIDPQVQQEKVDLGRAAVQALQEQAGGKTDTLPLGGMVDLGVINGVEVGPVPVTLIESSGINGRFTAPEEPDGKGYMELDVGRPPRSLKTVEERMPQLVKLFEHEAVHGFQQAARPEDDSYRPGMWSPGWDGVTDTVNLMSQDHARADMEFYPRIVSEVYEFLRSGDTSNEAARRWVENQQTFTIHRQPADAIVAKYIAAVNNDMPPLADEFYASLPREEGSLAAPTWSGDDIVRWAEQRAAKEPAYQKAMNKWRKAIRVFFQEIDKARKTAMNEDVWEEIELDPNYELGRPDYVDTMDSWELAEFDRLSPDPWKTSKRPSVLTPSGPAGLIDPDSEEAAVEFGAPKEMVGTPSDLIVKTQTIDARYDRDLAGKLKDNKWPVRGTQRQINKYYKNLKNNIRAVLSQASPETIRDYRGWYRDAHEHAQSLAEKHDVPLETVVGVIAAISPNTPWDLNLYMADQVLSNPDGYRAIYKQRARLLKPFNKRVEDLKEQQFDVMREDPEAAPLFEEIAALEADQAEAATKTQRMKLQREINRRRAEIAALMRQNTKATDLQQEINRTKEVGRERVYRYTKALGGPMYAENFNKAFAIINGTAEAVGPKVNVFYRSIMDPDAMAEQPTVDGHMINLARHTFDPLNELKQGLSEPERRLIERAYQEVSKEFTNEEGEPLTAQEAHAVAWVVWRSALENAGKKETQQRQPARQQPWSKHELDEMDRIFADEPVDWEGTFSDRLVDPEVLRRTNPFRPDAARRLAAAFFRSGHLSTRRWIDNHPAIQALSRQGRAAGIVEAFFREVDATRMRYQDGEIDMYEAEVGDQVKFVADFDKPGWPRVDAGTVGEVREVSPESGQLAVNVTGVERTAGDAVVVSRQTIPVPADAVVLMLHDEDERRA